MCLFSEYDGASEYDEHNDTCDEEVADVMSDCSEPQLAVPAAAPTDEVATMGIAHLGLRKWGSDPDLASTFPPDAQGLQAEGAVESKSLPSTPFPPMSGTAFIQPLEEAEDTSLSATLAPGLTVDTTARATADVDFFAVTPENTNPTFVDSSPDVKQGSGGIAMRHRTASGGSMRSAVGIPPVPTTVTPSQVRYGSPAPAFMSLPKSLPKAKKKRADDALTVDVHAMAGSPSLRPPAGASYGTRTDPLTPRSSSSRSPTHRAIRRSTAPVSWKRGIQIGEGSFGKVYRGMNSTTGTFSCETSLLACVCVCVRVCMCMRACVYVCVLPMLL